MDKLNFKGLYIQSNQNRLTRSFDEAHIFELCNKNSRTIDNQKRYHLKNLFSIGIGKAAQAKFNFKVNDVISGECLPVRIGHGAVYYKVSKLAKVARGAGSHQRRGGSAGLEVYPERGHRRLAARTYDTKCSSACGDAGSVEIIVDNWNPGVKEIRFEHFVMDRYRVNCIRLGLIGGLKAGQDGLCGGRLG